MRRAALRRAGVHGGTPGLAEVPAAGPGLQGVHADVPEHQEGAAGQAESDTGQLVDPHPPTHPPSKYGVYSSALE